MSMLDIRRGATRHGRGRGFRWWLLAALGGALLGTISPGMAERNYSVVVDGQPVTFSGAGPVDVSGRVLVPLRGVLERTGATVAWSPEERKVVAERGTTRVELVLGERTAKVNGKAVALDVPAMMMRGTTMVPLRFLVEALGATVQEAGGQIQIATRKPAAPPAAVAKRPTAPVAPRTSAPAGTAPPTSPASPVATAGARQTVDGVVERVDAQAKPARLAVRMDGQVLEYPLAAAAVVLAREGGEVGSARESTIAEVCPGDQVKAKLDSAGNITILVTLFDQVEGTVASVEGQTLDVQGAGKVSLTPSTRVVLPSGAAGTAGDLIGGETVRVRLKPGTREATLVTITKASERAAAPATAGAPPEAVQPAPATPAGETVETPAAAPTREGGETPAAPAATVAPVPETTRPGGQEDGPGEEAASATLKVTSFTHDAAAPLRAGATLTVTLEGEPGARATFDVGEMAVGLAMQERQPGVYVGTYTIPDGLNVRFSVFGRLERDGKKSPLVQAGVPVFVDSIAPTASDLAPPKGERVEESQPVIYAVF
ncbi:MAG: copper amine oxidase N-terminal domain-containing protein, partial [Armatimonadota bacterium]|nr:copper amine oxidase N-terminal domain-containing protein [Armatimonadota bacterium]